MKKVVVSMATMLIFSLMSMTAFAGSGLSMKEAVNKAFKDAGVKKGQVTLFEAEKEKGKYEIEFTKKKNKAEYEYEISAKSGRILEKSVDYVYKHNSSKSRIGKKAAMKRVSKISHIKLSVIKKGTCRYEYDNKDKEGTYKLKFKKGNYKYEYELLAPTGKLIEYSREYVRR